MNVIILAAGYGTRLRERTQHVPKALIKIAGKPLLGYALEAFGSRPWVESITVVTGFERSQVLDFLSTVTPKVPTNEVWNADFSKGNFYSLLCGLRSASAPFLITNADHIFPTDLLDEVHLRATAVSAICDFDRKLTPDCMKVELYSPKDSLQVAKIHKKLETYDCGYIGMTAVTLAGQQHYESVVRRLEHKGDVASYAEQVLDELAKDRTTAPHVVDASGYGWLEIDTEEDYRVAEKTLQVHPQFLSVGVGA